MKIKLVKIQTLNFDSMKAVVVDGREIGFITKYRNTKFETHPWKAYLGKGETSRHLEATYVSEKAAVDIILKADRAPFGWHV